MKSIAAYLAAAGQKRVIPPAPIPVLDKDTELARAGVTPTPATMAFEDAEALRLDWAARGTAARSAVAAAQVQLGQLEEAYREAVIRGEPANQDAIEAQERIVRREQRSAEAIELAAARHEPVWARAQVADLRAQAQRERATAAEAQAAIDRLAAEIVTLQRRQGEHVQALTGALDSARQLEARADVVTREYGLLR